MERVLAIKDHKGLCWKCLQNKPQIHNIKISSMGYGSGFDGWSTEIHLCEECYKESIKDNPELWSMEERHDLYGEGYGEDYKYEDEMFEYIKALPLQGKQFVYNEFPYGWNASNTMNPQDWIDYALDILPHEECKKYMLYSPDEKKAYRERFTTCQFPVNRIYSDGSKGCWCPFNANGSYGQEVGLNISDKCYQCQYYTKRTTPIKDISNEEFEGYKIDVKFMIRHGKEIQELYDKIEEVTQMVTKKKR